MRYAVHCYHRYVDSVHSSFTMETDNYSEVEEEAKNEAIELVQSYGPFMEKLWKIASNCFTNEDDVNDCYMNLVDECAGYEIIPMEG